MSQSSLSYRPSQSMRPALDQQAPAASTGAMSALVSSLPKVVKPAQALSDLDIEVSRVIEQAIARVETVIDEETAALKGKRALDLTEFNARKSQGLLELTRAMRGKDGSAIDATIPLKLSQLRKKLDINRATLSLHLEAVREISGMLADAVRQSDSDGTYSRATQGRSGTR